MRLGFVVLGGGEPLLHPHMIEMIEYAKLKGARVWLNTNGSMFGPTEKLRHKLERVVRAGIDLIEFSMDAADPETYAILRPPRSGKTQNPEIWWSNMLTIFVQHLHFESSMSHQPELSCL